MSYRFGDVEIDAEGFRVTRAGEPVHLEPKAIELLLFLAGTRGRLVTKAEIQGVVWKDTSVTESALTRLVGQLRRGLGDDAKEARYIETVPTRGYRFVAAPLAGERGDSGSPAPAGPDPARREAGAAGAAADAATRRWRPGPRATAFGAAALVLGLAGLSLWLVSARPRPFAASPSGHARRTLEKQVSTAATLNVFPRFSPDGSTIAFATLRGGSMEIVARAVAVGAREVALTSDGMQNVQPEYSPDGRLIAYHSVGRGGIWLVPSLGGVPRRLTSFGSDPAWSPDGSLIAFQGQSWVGSGDGNWSAGEGSTIWVVPAAGGEPWRVTTIGQVGPGGQGGASWSPDGRLLSFVAGMRAFVVRPDGSGLRLTSRDVWVRDVVWEKDGRSQIWTGSELGNWLAWRVPVAADTGLPVGEPEVLAGGGESASAWAHPALSPDGRSIAYVTFRTRHQVLSQRVTPAGRPEGEPEPLVTRIAGRKIPVLSPDGRRLAFGTVRPGVGRALWVADLGSGEARLLAEQPGIGLFWSRAWFPDGQRLGFVARAERGRSFWSVDVETGETREHRPLEDHVSSSPALSPDGRSLIAHGARRGALNVWVMGLEGGPARPLTNDAEGMGWPVWSPDGARIGVEVMRGGNTHVGWMAATGGPVHEVVEAPGQSWPYSFSPDGTRIAFAGQRGGIWNVYWAAVDGGAEQRVTSYVSPALHVRYPDWSSTGDRIVYEHAESTSTVWVRDLAPPARP
jgi:Tol biopolymer transport system component/DNA-binding winged helix-turn-helix (wHTH) protein